jgi:hypothetical protein
MNKKHILLWGLVGVAVGVYLAGAASGTGIYATPIGTTLANLYTSGNTAGGAVASGTAS